MTFVLATLVFLTAAWLAVVALAGTLEQYRQKIRAALAGEPKLLLAQAMTVRTSLRYPNRRPLRIQARPALRAAA